MKASIRKGILILLIAVISCLSLVGCHGKPAREGFEVPESFSDDKQIELTFWTKNDTNKIQTEIYEKAIADFEKLYPNIKVNIRLYTDYGRIYNDVITNISTGTTPNVCITYPDHIATYMTGENVVVPLDSLIEDKKYGLGGSEVRFDGPAKDEVVDKFMQECVLADAHYAMPFMRSSEVCYINKTYVEQLGYMLPDKLTWDFIWEVSEKAMEKGSDDNYLINNQKVMIPFIYKSTDNMMIQMLYQQNAGYSDAYGNINIFNDATKDILFTVSEHAKTGAFSTFKISSYPANFLNAGQGVFAIDSTAGSTWMGSKAPLSDICNENIVDYEMAVMPIPQYDVNNPRMISQGPSICIFNKEDSDEVLASWLFTQYLLTNEVQLAYAETEGYVPVTLKAQRSEEYQDYLSREGEDDFEHYDIKIKATKIILDNIDNTFVTPVFNGSASLRDASGQMIEDVTKSTRRKKNVNDEFIDELYSSVTSLYRLDQISGDENAAAVSGPLPRESVLLIAGLITIWVILGAGFIIKKAKAPKDDE